MSDSKDDLEKGITKEAIGAYAVKLGVNHTEARKRLEENYQAEIKSIDAKEIALKCMKGLRLLTPQLMGVVLREKDLIYKMNNLESKVNGFQSQINDLIEDNIEMKKEMIQQTDAFKKGAAILVEIKLKMRPPKGFWNRVKWIFKRN